MGAISGNFARYFLKNSSDKYQYILIKWRMFILKKQDFYKGNRKNSIVNAKNKNAVIWYAKDAFDPSENLNGRRVAGASFLKGYFDHAEADEFVSLVNGRGGAEEFKAIANNMA